MDNKSFSLIEVLIFVTVLTLFFVVAAAVTSATIRNMKINEHKTIATHYADELTEWLKYQKESDWTSFVTLTGQRCFGTDLSSLGSGLSYPCVNKIDQTYSRSATFSPSSNIVKVQVKVEWIESGDIPYSVTQNTLFTLNE